MSIEVTLDDLPDEIARRSFCYLLTVSDDDRPHAVALRAVADGDVLRLEAGTGRASRNAVDRPHVTLLFPPIPDGASPEGFTLVVDGEATVDGPYVDVRPSWAVLHRAAPGTG